VRRDRTKQAAEQGDPLRVGAESCGSSWEDEFSEQQFFSPTNVLSDIEQLEGVHVAVSEAPEGVLQLHS
jgi:hypothetical protein